MTRAPFPADPAEEAAESEFAREVGAEEKEAEAVCLRAIALLCSHASNRLEAVLHLATNGHNIAIVDEFDVVVADDLVPLDRPLKPNVVGQPHRQRSQFEAARGWNRLGPHRKTAFAVEQFARLHVLLGGGDSVPSEIL